MVLRSAGRGGEPDQGSQQRCGSEGLSLRAVDDELQSLPVDDVGLQPWPRLLREDALVAIVVESEGLEGKPGTILAFGVAVFVTDDWLDLQMPEIAAPVVFDDMERIAMRAGNNKLIILEARCIDHLRVALPFANGVSIQVRLGSLEVGGRQ